jgi:hypothetical protein
VFDVVTRSANARKESGELDAELQALRQQREQSRALAAECDELQTVIYQRPLDALPDDLRELFSLYSIVTISPYAVNQKSFKTFQSSSQKAKRLLALQGNKRSGVSKETKKYWMGTAKRWVAQARLHTKSSHEQCIQQAGTGCERQPRPPNG